MRTTVGISESAPRGFWEEVGCLTVPSCSSETLQYFHHSDPSPADMSVSGACLLRTLLWQSVLVMGKWPISSAKVAVERLFFGVVMGPPNFPYSRKLDRLLAYLGR
jgi:hypothetical protein